MKRSSRGPAPRRSSGQSQAANEPPPGPRAPSITLVVGTDTGVGKTWVTCALARALRALGQDVIAIKPFETGCTGEHPEREDGALLAAATGQLAPTQALIRLKSPVAVALAADEEGVTLDVDAVVNQIRGFASSHALTLVEGVGGLLAPITWHDNALDLAHQLEARVLVVSTDRLGTINHTLLTLRALESMKVPLLGVVLTAPEIPDESTNTNAQAIVRLSGRDLVVPVPRIEDPALAAEAVKEIAGWVLP